MKIKQSEYTHNKIQIQSNEDKFDGMYDTSIIYDVYFYIFSTYFLKINKFPDSL